VEDLTGQQQAAQQAQPANNDQDAAMTASKKRDKEKN
jgi:hypothetical protein